MANKFLIETVFKGKDLLRPVWKRNIKSAQLFGDKASRSFARASKGASMFGSVFKGVLAAGVVSRGFGFVRRGAEEVTREFIDFDDALTQAGAKFPVVIKRGTEGFKELGKVARAVGAETQFTAAEAAGGLNFLAMAGFDATQAMTALPGVTDLAVVANTDLARATDIASDSLGAFNLMSKDSVQLQKNLTRINDVMAKTITSTNTDLEQLFETMKFAGPVATAAGASIETFGALAGEMAQAGIKSSLSGTALRAAFTRLVDPPAQARKALKKLRTETLTSSGDMRDMIDIIEDLNKGTKGMGKGQRLAALSAIFGRRAVAGMNIVLNAGAKRLRKFRSELEMAGGSSKDMAANIRQSLGNQLKALKSALIEIGFKFVEAFRKQGVGSIDDLIKAVRQFDVKPIVAGIKEFFDIVRDLRVGFEELKPLIKAIVGATVVAKFFALAKAIKAVGVAQWVLNTAMLANPIGIVIVAIGVAIGLVAVLVKKWKTASAILKLTWLEVKNAVMDTVNAVIKFLTKFNVMIRFAQDLGLISKNITLFDASETAELKRQNELLKARQGLAEAIVKDNKNLTNEAIRRANLDRFKQAQGLAGGVSDTINQLILGEQSVPDITVPQIGFEGKMTFANAPKGAKFESKTRGAPQVQVEGLGAQ